MVAKDNAGRIRTIVTPSLGGVTTHTRHDRTKKEHLMTAESTLKMFRDLIDETARRAAHYREDRNKRPRPTMAQQPEARKRHQPSGEVKLAEETAPGADESGDEVENVFVNGELSDSPSIFDVSGFVNSISVMFRVDTGATRSMCTTSVAERLHLKPTLTRKKFQGTDVIVGQASEPVEIAVEGAIAEIVIYRQTDTLGSV
jgi:hypothetical protein